MPESNVQKTAKFTMDSFDAFDANILKISSILDAGFCDIAIIMTVSALEVLLTDLFKEYKNHWFTSKAGGHINSVSLEKRLETRKELRKYFQSIRAYDDFLKNYYVYQDQIDPEIDSAYETLFPEKGRNKLNFQNLKGEDGVRKAYMLFFGVDLMEMLDPNENISYNKWNDLTNLFDERHKIIHRGNSTLLSQENIKDTLKSLLYMREKLAEEFISCYPVPAGYIPSMPDRNVYVCSYAVQYSLI